jgi:quercetin dioxygenase-like cupin family protein
MVPAVDVLWTDVRNPDGSPLGLRTVDVWGSARMGAHGSLTTFPAGFAEPLHRHSNPIRVVVISGTMRNTVDGIESGDLDPGSYVAVAAEVPHFASCAALSTCEVLIERDAAMDVKLGR